LPACEVWNRINAHGLTISHVVRRAVCWLA
jgi:hypothetical protein